MASYTQHLKLLEKDPVADGGDTFNIQTMLNDNWDKIDAAVAGKAEAGAAPTAHAASHGSGGADPVTPAAIGAAVTKTLTCSAPVSWTASGGYYYQQVSVAGMLTSDNPIADFLPGSDNAANKLYAEAWGKVQSIDTLDGAVKIWCTAAPTTAFTVQFKVVR